MNARSSAGYEMNQMNAPITIDVIDAVIMRRRQRHAVIPARGGTTDLPESRTRGATKPVVGELLLQTPAKRASPECDHAGK
ncbi:hypothetical protein FRC09_005558, partial [Ceratobasidium sp. 395]